MMEHCKGGDLLEQLLKEGRAMPEKRVVREVVLPSLTALAHLHAAGIIHRCAHTQPSHVQHMQAAVTHTAAGARTTEQQHADPAHKRSCGVCLMKMHVLAESMVLTGPPACSSHFSQSCIVCIGSTYSSRN